MKSVAYTNPFVPAEWIRAHRLWPRRMTLRGPDGPAAVDVVRGVCPYARAFLQAALCLPQGKSLCDEQDAAVVMTTTCDQMRHAAALLAGREVFLLNVPSTCQTPAASKLYLDELERLGRFLVRLGGTAPSPEELAEVMLEDEHARRFPKVPDEDGRWTTSTGIPLAIVGGPLLENDRELFELISAAGGRVALDGTEGGLRTLPGEFDRERIHADPLGTLSEAYFGSIPDAFRRPNDAFYRWLWGEIAEREVRGLLFHRYVWCDLWHAEFYRLKRSSPVPVLELDAGGGDGGGMGRTVGRLEAFLEMLA